MGTPDAVDRLARLLSRLEIGRVVSTSARPTPPRGVRVHSIPEPRLIVPLEGRKVEIFADGRAVREWEMTPGDALLVRTETWLAPRFDTRHRHLGVIIGRERARVIWSRCDGDDAKPQPLVAEASFEVPLDERGAARAALDALCALDPEVDQEAARHLTLSFLHLLCSEATRPRAPLGKAERSWRETSDWLQDNCHLAIGRDDVARALGMSPNYLSRLCRRRTGRTLVATITELRLERAAAMLRAVDLPVAEVARLCGFNDASYFIRRFRRGFGATPAAYRRARRARRAAKAD